MVKNDFKALNVRLITVEILMLDLNLIISWIFIYICKSVFLCP